MQFHIVFVHEEKFARSVSNDIFLRNVKYVYCMVRAKSLNVIQVNHSLYKINAVQINSLYVSLCVVTPELVP
jgi:hypothetical protein